MEKMTEEQIETSLQDLPQWSEVNGVIQRTYQFKDFLGSMDFVQKIAAMAASNSVSGFGPRLMAAPRSRSTRRSAATAWEWW